MILTILPYFLRTLKKDAVSSSNQERVVSITFNGPFMQLREWMGFEGLCITFIEQPDLIRDMIGFWCEYVSVMLDKSLKLVKPDYVHIGEDMDISLKA